MATGADIPDRYVQAIRERGLTIYDSIEIGDPTLWIPSPTLEKLLRRSLEGISLKGLPLRTRSKSVKILVCKALGYRVPTSFRRTRPRFPGQLFDTYVQKSNNLQVWNEDLAPSRRYVIIRVSVTDAITGVRVVTGTHLARLDNTGTVTQKYQARLNLRTDKEELIVETDSDRLRPVVDSCADLRLVDGPTADPEAGKILPIGIIFQRLRKLVGVSFPHGGYTQERNRGTALHKLVCQYLGYIDYRDDGRFPDIRQQLLEVKLQTSQTIDLGLVSPSSEEPLDVPKIRGLQIRHCDVRYALFYATTDGTTVTLTHIFLTTGEHFFSRFHQFQGNVLNRKLQIPLPSDFFED
ncbi:MAG: restriction endonuclease [Thermodesulfobacteriota bacterium]